MHQLHEEVFACTDCLKCANCCSTTGPLFTDKDIGRIAKHLRIKPSEFTEKYLRIDEDKDYVLQQVPCAFLEEDNNLFFKFIELVPGAGLEPARSFLRGILSPLCLPIPPPGL